MSALEPWSLRLPSGRALVAAFCALMLLVLAARAAFGQRWGRRGCDPVGSDVSFQSSAPLRWGPCAGTECQVALFRGDVQIGTYCHAREVYCPYDAAAETWGAPCAPPIAPPHPPAGVGRVKADVDEGGGGDCTPAEEPVIYDGGLIQSELTKGAAETIWLGTNKITIERAVQAIEAVPNFRQKPRITVSGSEGNRAKLRAAATAAGLDAFLWGDYPADHWHLRDRDGKPVFRTDADPTLTVQAPDGTVTGRMDGVLPADLAALRKAPPYDPARDPDPRKQPAPGPSPVPASAPSSPSLLVWLGGAALALLALLSRNTQPPK